MPVAPVGDIFLAHLHEGGEQGRDDLLAGLSPDASETEREHKLAVACRQVNLSCQCDISVFCPVVIPCHLEVLRDLAIRPMCQRILPNASAMEPRNPRQARKLPAAQITWACPYKRRPSLCYRIQNCRGGEPAGHRDDNRSKYPEAGRSEPSVVRRCATGRSELLFQSGIDR